MCLRNRIPRFILLLAVAVVLVGGLFACRQPPREQVTVERGADGSQQTRELPGAGGETGKKYVRGIEATGEVESALKSLEALSPQGSLEAATVPDDLVSTVSALLADAGVPLDNKILLLTVYQEKAMWLPPRFLSLLAQQAEGAELIPELDYSLAQLFRNELRRMRDRSVTGGLTASELSALSHELADGVVKFFRAAYEDRKIEPLYVMGLLGAYYDRAMALEGGRKPQDQDVLEGLSPELQQELFRQLDHGEVLRALVGPPWLLYRAYWPIIPPNAVGRRLIWGSASTSAGDALLVLFRQKLAGGRWRDSFNMLQRFRTTVADEVPNIEWAENVDEMVRVLVKSLSAGPFSAEEKKTARQLLADFEEFSTAWKKQREEERKKRNQLLAEGKFEEARKSVDMYTREAMQGYQEIIDRVEDMIRPHSAEEARREREQEAKTKPRGHWRKLPPGTG